MVNHPSSSSRAKLYFILFEWGSSVFNWLDEPVSLGAWTWARTLLRSTSQQAWPTTMAKGNHAVTLPSRSLARRTLGQVPKVPVYFRTLTWAFTSILFDISFFCWLHRTRVPQSVLFVLVNAWYRAQGVLGEPRVTSSCHFLCKTAGVSWYLSSVSSGPFFAPPNAQEFLSPGFLLTWTFSGDSVHSRRRFVFLPIWDSVLWSSSCSWLVSISSWRTTSDSRAYMAFHLVSLVKSTRKGKQQEVLC